ncbi:MAG: ATP-grasp domain-containing protein [Patescibacteria group bacterium]|nr:ATP-grasp domain-containing protein [Patescibacteria group bacterium]MCL5224320.1 ATP-grasp domain-containing protein [Patescibacteria group bacterium]
MKRILVTGAGGSAAYNFIESLRSNPKDERFYIVGADMSRYHIELAHVDKRYIIPGVDDPNYIDKLNKLIEKEKIDFVHSQPDVEVNFLSKNKSRIRARTFLPDPETVEICQNKMQFNSLLKTHDIAVPDAFYLRSEKDLEAALQNLFRTNEKVWVRAIRGAGSRAALPVKKLEHAKMWIDYWKEMKGLGYGDFMVSEFLPGREYAFQSLWLNGELIMSQARERIEYIFGNLTPSGQSSSPSVARTVQNEEINQLVYKAVKVIDPKASGIFCADMKTDKNGKIKLIEINVGRFFTTSFFFSKAGANMPYYYTKIGLGEEVNSKLKQFDNVPPDWYWVRMIDMGYKLIKDDEWTGEQI